jgi:D-amino-acid oxidase
VDVLVVGAGVVGLTAAVRLREAGHDAHVHARDMPGQTTSAVAAALWYPYRAYPADLVTRWSARAYEVFTALADDPGVPVRVRHGRELWREPVPDPWWRDAVRGFARVPPEALPPGYADGYAFPAPVVEMSAYLDWLAGRLAGLGGTLARRTYATLDEARAVAPVVVDCSGLGAYDLVPDRTLTPVRGQVVRVSQVGLTEWVLDGTDPAGPTYVVPREHDVVCGGTASDGDWRLEPDPGTAEDVLARCRALVPALADAEVREHRVGLRPARPAVRLEAEPSPGGGVVHCYGHGGAGVTLSWGCADDVVVAVDRLRA